MRSETAWSILSPVPHNFYFEDTDSHITFWNGVAMTQTYARLIVAQIWMNMFFTESVKEQAWLEFNRIYRSNGFKTKDWDKIIENCNFDDFPNKLIKFLTKSNKNFLRDLREKYSPQEALSWFLPSKENVVKQSTEV